MSQVIEFPLVWITGASTGIGRALAMRLADHGSTVLASARDVGKLDELEAASNDLVGHIIALPLDVTDNDGVRAAYERIFAEHGVPDLCVLNAGTDDFEQMEALLADMEASLDDPKRFSEFDTQFHARLAETTRNQLLVWIIQQINAVRNNSEWLSMLSLTLDQDMIRDYNIAHRALVDAIRARDADLAARLMRDHLQSARLSITTAMDT